MRIVVERSEMATVWKGKNRKFNLGWKKTCVKPEGVWWCLIPWCSNFTLGINAGYYWWWWGGKCEVGCQRKVFWLSIFDVLIRGEMRTGRVKNRCWQELRQEAAHTGQRLGQVSKGRKRPFLALMLSKTHQDLARAAR